MRWRAGGRDAAGRWAAISGPRCAWVRERVDYADNFGSGHLLSHASCVLYAIGRRFATCIDWTVYRGLPEQRASRIERIHSALGTRRQAFIEIYTAHGLRTPFPLWRARRRYGHPQKARAGGARQAPALLLDRASPRRLAPGALLPACARSPTAISARLRARNSLARRGPCVAPRRRPGKTGRQGMRRFREACSQLKRRAVGGGRAAPPAASLQPPDVFRSSDICASYHLC